MPIRVHKVEEFPDGTIEIAFHGGEADFQYLKGRVCNLKGVSASEKFEKSGSENVLHYFRAKGTKADSLTRRKVIDWFRDDQGIELSFEE